MKARGLLCPKRLAAGLLIPMLPEDSLVESTIIEVVKGQTVPAQIPREIAKAGQPKFRIL
jgi:hypothetical protein